MVRQHAGLAAVPWEDAFAAFLRRVAPVERVHGWAAGYLGRAFKHATIELLAQPLEERDDPDAPHEQGPLIEPMLETVEWRGNLVRVPPLQAQLHVCRERGLHQRAELIRTRLRLPPIGVSLGRCCGGHRRATLASVGLEDRRRRLEALEGAVDAERQLPQELRDRCDALQRAARVVQESPSDPFPRRWRQADSHRHVDRLGGEPNALPAQLSTRWPP